MPRELFSLSKGWRLAKELPRWDPVCVVQLCIHSTNIYLVPAMWALSQLSWVQIPAGPISRVALSSDLTLSLSFRSPSLVGWQRRA